jgi:2-C-methyl-D-erythritol 4-phosphate cytidylyltransferase
MGPSDPATENQQNLPKQYRLLNGRAVLSCTLARLLEVQRIESVLVLLRESDQHWQTLAEANSPRIRSGIGGAERQASVLNGLRQLPAEPDDWVLVHDAVRPCVTVGDVETLISRLAEHPVGGLLAAPVDNTLKRASKRLEVEATVDRSELYNALTPQMFRYGALLSALTGAVQAELPVTDEASAIELAGYKPLLVPGDKQNIKITHEADLTLAALILRAQENLE